MGPSRKHDKFFLNESNNDEKEADNTQNHAYDLT